MSELDFYKPRDHREIPIYADVTDEQWNDPVWQLRNAITTGEQLARVITLTQDQVHHINGAIKETRPMRITPYYATLMDPDPLNLRDADGDVMPKIDPIFRQAVPTLAGVFFPRGNPDMGEEERSFKAAYGRYPDRIALISTNVCEMFCTHCQRQKGVGLNKHATDEQIREGLDYIQANTNIRDVLITGGDALTLPKSRLVYILERLSNIRHVQNVRIGTRLPVTDPYAVTDDVVELLENFSRSPSHPEYPQITVSTHVNHPHEITKEFYGAVYKLQRAGFLVRNQMVAINGVNDDFATMTETLIKLYALGVQPHYILQGHEIERLGEFLVPIPHTYENFLFMRGLLSGPAIPKFIVNMNGGGGKVDLTPIGVGMALRAIEDISKKYPPDHPMHGVYSPYRYLKPWEMMGPRRAYAELMPMTQGEYELMMGEMAEFYGPTTGRYEGQDKFRPNINLVREIKPGARVEVLYASSNYVATTNLRVNHLTVKDATAIQGFNDGTLGAINKPSDAFRLLRINAALYNGSIIPGEDRKFFVKYLFDVGGIGGITADKAQKFLAEDREALVRQLIGRREVKGVSADRKRRYYRKDGELNVRHDELRRSWVDFLAKHREVSERPFDRVTIEPPRETKSTKVIRN